MVLDFAKVKKQIKRIIDEKLDHKLAVPSELACKSELQAGRYSFEYQQGDTHIAMSAPEQAVCVIAGEEVTTASAIAYLKSQIMPHMPSNVKDVDITLRPEQANGFYYHYSHGLKKHDGNCQRIIHGHRSLIGIKLNDISIPRLQKQWADKWQDIYLGSEEDLIPSEQLKYVEAKDDDYSFAYTSSQGYFELAISQSRCDILPCDTTVECIAEYLAQQIKLSHPNDKVTVKAYEGVGKGAIAYA